MKACEKVQETLCAYSEGDLSPEEKKFVQEHLDSCDSCSTALRDLRKTEELSRNLEEVEPPPWMAAKIMARVKAESEKKGIVRKLFFPLHLKIPLEAMATVFIAVLAVYVFRAVEPEMKSMPVPPSVGPGIAREEGPKPSSEQARVDTLAREKQAAKEQEKKVTAPPASPPSSASVTQEEPRASALPPAEERSAGKKKEAPPENKEEMVGLLKTQEPSPSKAGSQAALADRDSAARSEERPADLARKAEMGPAPPPAGSAPAPPLASAPAPTMASPPGEHRFKGSAVPERQRNIVAPAPKATAPPALRQQRDLFEISLFVEDLKVAGMEVRNLLNQAGASNIKSESREGQELVTAEMDALKVKKFMEELKGVGEIRDKLDSPQVSATDPIAIQIKLQAGH